MFSSAFSSVVAVEIARELDVDVEVDVEIEVVAEAPVGLEVMAQLVATKGLIGLTSPVGSSGFLLARVDMDKVQTKRSQNSRSFYIRILAAHSGIHPLWFQHKPERRGSGKPDGTGDRRARQ